MKNILILFICFFLNSCLTEPKKDIKIEPKTELKNDADGSREKNGGVI